MSTAVLIPVKTLPLAPVLEDLELRADRVRTIGDPPSPAHVDAHHAAIGVPPGLAPENVRESLVAFAEREISPDGSLLLFLEGARSDPEIARWRNALWPFGHVVRVYRLANSQIARQSIDGTQMLRRGSGLRGIVLVARRREVVLAPDATVQKFDKNAASWNGDPGQPTYAHFRWMRRYVACFAAGSRARRILDFGCGAGWVGIEAALRAPGAALRAFDPSPEMVRIAGENARESGIADFEGRTGFGEDPPYPGEGEEPFDLVISSGVISFATDRERWLDGLVRALEPQATLVIGDIDPQSRGMQARRAQRPLLPVREMNAQRREDVRAALERRGLSFEAWAGYQLTSPVPGLMHFDATRLRGALSRPILWANQAATALHARTGAAHVGGFDSWVMRFTKRA